MMLERLETTRTNFDLVVDGLDDLSPTSVDVLTRVASRLPEGHRLWMVGREAGILPLERWVLEGRVAIIEAARLAFSLEETTEVLSSRDRAHDAARVHERLEGWPAGVALVALGASPHVEPQHLITNALARIPEPFRSALPDASVLEVWSRAGVKPLRLALPEGWLEAALRHGLPLTPLGMGEFRPHRLLLEALETALRSDAVRHAALHLGAGHHAESAGNLLAALAHFRAAGVLEEAVRVARAFVKRHWRVWSFPAVRQALERFEPDELPVDLKVALGRALIETGEPALGEILLRRVHASGYDMKVE